MITIEDVLKKDRYVRIIFDDKWLVWSSADKQYVVYQKKHGERITHKLFIIADFSRALEELIKENGNGS